eukprot:jgi/Pico_ML_1/54428/g4774.t1
MDGSLWVISRARGVGPKRNDEQWDDDDDGDGGGVAKTWELGQVVDAAVDVAQAVSDELLEDMREWQIERRVESLQNLKRQLAIALGQVHMLTDALAASFKYIHARKAKNESPQDEVFWFRFFTRS